MMRAVERTLHVAAILLIAFAACPTQAETSATVVELKWDDANKTISNQVQAEDLIREHPSGAPLTLRATGANVPSDLKATLQSGTYTDTRDFVVTPPATDRAAEFAGNLFPQDKPYNLAISIGPKTLIKITWNQQPATLGGAIACMEEMKAAMFVPTYWDDVGRVEGTRKASKQALPQGQVATPSYRNRVELRYGPDGRRVSRLPEHIDANDEIMVFVIAPVEELGNYTVDVVSGEYAPAYLNIHQGGALPERAVRQSDPGQPVRVCGERGFDLGRYTSGTLVFRISHTAKPDAGQTHTLRINPLYHGTIRLGVVGTALDDPTFGVLTPAGGTAQEIFVSDEGDRARYVIEYVPFILTPRRWAGRDILKQPRGWDRVNLPVLGFDLDDPDENVYIGVDIEITRGIALTGGLHYGKRKELADGFRVGLPFAGSATEIPTSNEWDAEAYYGLSVDLFVVGKAFKGIFSGGD